MVLYIFFSNPRRLSWEFSQTEFSMYLITNLTHMQASCTCTSFITKFWLRNKMKTVPYNLLLPVSLLCCPDRSAALSALPCRTANFGAGEQPIVLFLKSSWLGYAAPESVSNSTWCPHQTSLSWPAGGKMERWGAEADWG